MNPLLPEDPPAVGPYRLFGRLGAGGQGVVYLGQGPDGRPVAVKLLADGLAGDHRFAKEIDAARRVEPFCIAQVLDASLGGRPYIVTEYVEGPTLHEAGRHVGADLQRLAVATATALAAIHRAGVVHRDFKPANVLLGRDGPRVIDFGIARAAGHSLTVTSSIVGTPAYMAPEQLAGAPLGPAVDVFAWASVIVFAATGSPPFGDDSLPAVIRRILHDEPYLGDLPAPLRPIVLSCLAKDPAARPAMQDVLLRLIGAPAPPAGTAGDLTGRRAGTAGPVVSSPRWKVLLAGAGALAVSGALVAGAIMLLPDTTTPTAAPLPSATKQQATTTSSPPAKKQGTDKTPSTPAKKPRPTRTGGSNPTSSVSKQPTPKPTASPRKTTTTAAAGGTVRLASLTLDGQQTGPNCYSPSLFPVALLTGPSGKQIEYGYRWVVDGQDEGWKTDWVTGTTKNRRNPFGAFEPGRHTIVFHLLTPSKATKGVTFTVCER
ncbi:serine/threonine-protein kinase [Nonomuraea aurantiaca]|uniref:serine/threonine-protein kinase n=1 Tax=Nonomuraea aurantiaca TaxID=2878562 RepID=UPI001CDA23F6|nr:serine/threonine-protein kinase [Nonomuraea aurantiaca]MCA2228473.1 protein kinase [Nonomuraea aurantiaca]